MTNRTKEIIARIEEYFPNAKCELNHSNSLELTIAVMLSAQTTDKAVNNVTKDLFTKYKSINEYINTDISIIEEDIKRLGLYKNKARHIKGICEKLKQDYNSEVPNDLINLQTLPGVGRKTANVILSEWFNVPRIAVDTHVFRVSKRLELVDQSFNELQVEKELMNILDESIWSSTHHLFIFFGRYHCKARNPLCNNCTLSEYCNYNL